MTVATAVRRLDAQIGDLLERHQRGRSLSEFSGYVDDPVGFVRGVLRSEPWSSQVEIAVAVKDAPLVVVRSANAVGKDWMAARLALWWVYARRGLVLLTGPTERQVREVVMGEVSRAFRQAKDLPGDLYQMALRLGPVETAGILAFTSTEASRLTGFHAPRILAVLTEAQGVEDFAWEGLLACATGTEDRVLAVGNPLTPTGRFYAASRPQSGWESIGISAAEHPNLTGERTIPGGPTAEFMERIATEYGESSPIYQARVLGEFPDTGEDSLFRRSWIDAAAARHSSPITEIDVAHEDPIAAVDPARFGPDHTVVAIAHGPRVDQLVSWGQVDLMETVDRIVGVLRGAQILPARDVRDDERLQQYAVQEWLVTGHRPVLYGPIGRVLVDDVGVGAGVADRLNQLGYAVELFNGGHSPWAAADRERFANRRAEAYWRLRQLLEAGEVMLPPDPELVDELLATSWRPTAEGKVSLPPKEQIKGLIGRSPDRADAVVMAAWWWWQQRESRVAYDPAQWPVFKQ